MALMPSQEVINFLNALGMQWPQANEDELREAADYYRRTGGDFDQIQEEFVKVSQDISEGFSGATAESFLNLVNQMCAGENPYLAMVAAQAEQLAENADKTATDVEHTKWSVIGQIIAMIAQMAITAFLSWFFGPAVMLGMSFEYAMVREFVLQLLTALAKSVLLQTAIGAGVGFLTDFTIQEVQIGQHHRDSLDTNLLKQSVVAGAIGGAIAAPFDLIGLGIGKAIGNAIGKGTKGALTSELTHLVGGEATNKFGKGLLGAGSKVAPGIEKGAATAGKGAAATEHSLTGPMLDMLTREERGALAKDLGSLLSNTQAQFSHGFGKGFKPGEGFVGGKGTVAQAFTDKTEALFEKHLGGKLFPEGAAGHVGQAGKLGRDWGEALVTHWEKGVGSEAFQNGLQDAVKPYAKELGAGGAQLFAKDVPEALNNALRDHLHGNFLYKAAGFGTGVTLDGVNNMLSDGVVTYIYEGKFELKPQAFVGGAVLGAAGRGLGEYVMPAAQHAIGAGWDKLTGGGGGLPSGATPNDTSGTWSGSDDTKPLLADGVSTLSTTDTTSTSGGGGSEADQGGSTSAAAPPSAGAYQVPTESTEHLSGADGQQTGTGPANVSVAPAHEAPQPQLHSGDAPRNPRVMDLGNQRSAPPAGSGGQTPSGTRETTPQQTGAKESAAGGSRAGQSDVKPPVASATESTSKTSATSATSDTSTASTTSTTSDTSTTTPASATEATSATGATESVTTASTEHTPTDGQATEQHTGATHSTPPPGAPPTGFRTESGTGGSEETPQVTAEHPGTSPQTPPVTDTHAAHSATGPHTATDGTHSAAGTPDHSSGSSAGDLVDTLERARDGSGGTGDDGQLRPMTRSERQEWAELQVLEAARNLRPPYRLDEAAIHAESEAYLTELHEALAGRFQVSADGGGHLAPPPYANDGPVEDASGHGGQDGEGTPVAPSAGGGHVPSSPPPGPPPRTSTPARSGPRRRPTS